MADLVQTFQELNALGVGFVSLSEPLDLTTPSGRAMSEMLVVFAEFERQTRRGRVKAGISRAPAGAASWSSPDRGASGGGGSSPGVARDEISPRLRGRWGSAGRRWPEDLGGESRVRETSSASARSFDGEAVSWRAPELKVQGWETTLMMAQVACDLGAVVSRPKWSEAMTCGREFSERQWRQRRARALAPTGDRGISREAV